MARKKNSTGKRPIEPYEHTGERRVNKRDVKDGSDDDRTPGPATLNAFHDAWELGIHSYLT